MRMTFFFWSFRVHPVCAVDVGRERPKKVEMGQSRARNRLVVEIYLKNKSFSNTTFAYLP